jgi:hypothetical protein
MLMISVGCSVVRRESVTESVPEQAGPWRVTVGPAGNEFYQAPEVIPLPPPSPEIQHLVDEITGDAEVGEWGGSDGMYRVIATTDVGRYRAFVDTAATLHWLVYLDDESEAREVPSALVWKGTRRSITVADLPEPAVRMLHSALPEVTLDSAWIARSAVGERYVIRAEEWVFFATPEGRIRAGGLVRHGAGNEVDSVDVADIVVDAEEFHGRMHEMLGPYRNRFGVESMIERLASRDPGEGKGFRFVVLGDSRSQFGLWSNGDIVPRGYVEELHDYYIPPLLETNIPYFVAIGNHDVGGEGQATEYRYLFGENSLNFHFDYGGFRFVFMDNVSAAQPYDQTLTWLDSILSQTPPGFRQLVFTHRPPADIEKWAYHSWNLESSTVFTQTMTRHGVEHVFLGHIHAYSTAMKDGVAYTISGGGGAGLHDRYGPDGNVHHYLICDVEPDGLLTQEVVRFYPVDSLEVREPRE